MPVRTPNDYIILGLFVIYMGIWVYSYNKLAQVTKFGGIVIPIGILYTLLTGFQNDNFYQLAKMIFYFNIFNIILFFIVNRKIKAKWPIWLFIIFITIGNIFSIFRHIKYYTVQQLDKQFFSLNQLKELKLEIENKNYKNALVNSGNYALWEFYYQNKLPINIDTVRTQSFDDEIFKYLKYPKDNVLISFPHWANRLLDTEYYNKNFGSISVIRPGAIGVKNDTKNYDLINKNKAIFKNSDNLIFLCGGKTTFKKKLIFDVEEYEDKLIFIYVKAASEISDAARIELIDPENNRIITSKFYKEKGFLINSDLGPGRLVREVKKNEKYFKGLSVNYRVPKGTSRLELKYAFQGDRSSECAFFKDTQILRINNL
jgi:hypothetical protein